LSQEKQIQKIIPKLKEKFSQIMQLSFKKDPKAETIFLAFFNAVKDNDDLFKQLLVDRKQIIDETITKIDNQKEELIKEKTEVENQLPKTR